MVQSLALCTTPDRFLFVCFSDVICLIVPRPEGRVRGGLTLLAVLLYLHVSYNAKSDRQQSGAPSTALTRHRAEGGISLMGRRVGRTGSRGEDRRPSVDKLAREVRSVCQPE